MTNDELEAVHPETADPATLVARLRGVYAIPIKDGLGCVAAGNETPDDPTCFTKTYPVPPIHRAAAARIEELELRATRAEAHAERLVGAGEAVTRWLDGLRNMPDAHAVAVPFGRLIDLRQALSAYRGSKV